MQHQESFMNVSPTGSLMPTNQTPAINQVSTQLDPAQSNVTDPSAAKLPDKMQISGAARELASTIAAATEVNESAVTEKSESMQKQIAEHENVSAVSQQPPVNQATQKTITTRIDVVA